MQTMTAQGSMISYTRSVRSMGEFSTLTSNVADAEGGGFGVTVSASAQYLTTSHFTAKSVSFVVGASGTTHKRFVQNDVKLELTQAAKKLLQHEPEEFAKSHGLHFVWGVVYGIPLSLLPSRPSEEREELIAEDHVPQ